MFECFGIPHKITNVGLYSGTMQADLAAYSPARTVPVAVTPDGHVLTDSLSIAETLVERHPRSGLLPDDPAARALARNLICEMHSGFSALRNDCPMNLRTAWQGFKASELVKMDLARIETLWGSARSQFGTESPWLFGDFSLADVFYAPVAARIAGYGLPVGTEASRYVEAHMTHPAFLAWRTEALAEIQAPEQYNLDLPTRPWP